jgi:hypothetical protein
MFLPDSKTVLLQGKARYNEELSQCHFYKSYKGPNSFTILNSKRLSKEIYNKLSPLENLEVDSIKGISKWKSDMETDINFFDH